MLFACYLCDTAPILVTLGILVFVGIICYPEYRRKHPRASCASRRASRLTLAQWKCLDPALKRLVGLFVFRRINARQFNFRLSAEHWDVDLAKAAVDYLDWQILRLKLGVTLFLCGGLLFLLSNMIH